MSGASNTVVVREVSDDVDDDILTGLFSVWHPSQRELLSIDQALSAARSLSDFVELSTSTGRFSVGRVQIPGLEAVDVSKWSFRRRFFFEPPSERRHVWWWWEFVPEVWFNPAGLSDELMAVPNVGEVEVEDPRIRVLIEWSDRTTPWRTMPIQVAEVISARQAAEEVVPCDPDGPARTWFGRSLSYGIVGAGRD